MTRFWYILLVFLCAVTLISGLIWVMHPGLMEPPARDANYLLLDNHGHLALYTADGSQMLQEYDIYTRLLPETDYIALQQGVEVQDEAQLERLLEDYGL